MTPKELRTFVDEMLKKHSIGSRVTVHTIELKEEFTNSRLERTTLSIIFLVLNKLLMEDIYEITTTDFPGNNKTWESFRICPRVYSRRISGKKMHRTVLCSANCGVDAIGQFKKVIEFRIYNLLRADTI